MNTRSSFIALLLTLLVFTFAAISAQPESEPLCASDSNVRGVTGGASFTPAGVGALPGAFVDPASVRLRTPSLRGHSRPSSSGIIPELDEWELFQSLTTYGSIPAGEYYSLRLDLPWVGMSEQPPENNLSDYCIEAVNRAPQWLRNDLVDNLLQFGDLFFFADLMADAILNAEDPYVDEVAFIIAHISPVLLLNGQLPIDLIMENVEGVYAADEYLDYVQINDYGTSADDDYWSTAEYTMCTAEGDTVQVEIDRDIYYWYVVHPRLSDEIPCYINPETGNVSNPPEGKFWRDFLLNEPDEGYSSLRDYVEGCDIMYGNLTNDNSDANGAVGAVTRYIQDIMEFGSGAERPIQPVRIYNLHLGRCGEHQDITQAAARAALIPAVGTNSLTEDHVWNEFWDGYQWTQWEPVNNYVNNPLAYEGWGKHFPAIFDWRGDGWIWTVTERYHTNTTTLAVHINDAVGNPVDGAQVKMYSDYLYGGRQFATCGYTDSDGYVEFAIGGEKNIYLRVSSALGTYPNDPYGTLVIEDSDPDVEYEWTYAFDDTMTIVTPGIAETPPDPTDHYYVELTCNSTNEAAYGQIFSNSNFVAEVGDGCVDMFICDEENFAAFEAGEAFEAFEAITVTDTEEVGFTVPVDGAWYVVLSNTNSAANYQRFDLTANLYVDDSFSVDGEETGRALEYALYSNYPNPFNPGTTIRFSLARPGPATLTVFNINGREVVRRELGNLGSGVHSAYLDLSGQASGVYLYRVESGAFRADARMILLK